MKLKINESYIKDNYDTAVSAYKRLEKYKESSKLYMWEQCANLTLPYIFPEQGATESSELNVPYNSIGPAAVNNLASKLTLALLPTAGSFFRLIPFKEIVEGLSVEQLQELETELRNVETTIEGLIKIQGLTVSIFEAVKLLIVTGNTLLYKVKKKSFKVFNPRHYCVERDFEGAPISIIIKESIDKKLLPKDFLENEINKKKIEQAESEDLDIYTCIYRLDSNKWIAYQEVEDEIIESTIKEYDHDTMPYIPLRWTNIHNENYGRGLVEQYLGDFKSLEAASRAIIEGSVMSAKTIFGIKPMSTVKARDIKNARNGDIIAGDLDTITTLKSEKATDFNIAYKVIENLENRLGKAFLMFTSSVRDSERTTSTEIRATINELDAAFGGTYAVLAQDLQVPLVKLLIEETNPKALKITTPSIITGNAAISRQKDVENLDYLLSKLAVFGPEVLSRKMKVDGYIREMATALGIDPSRITKTREEEAEEEALMQQNQNMQQ